MARHKGKNLFSCLYVPRGSTPVLRRGEGEIQTEAYG